MRVLLKSELCPNTNRLASCFFKNLDYLLRYIALFDKSIASPFFFEGGEGGGGAGGVKKSSDF